MTHEDSLEHTIRPRLDAAGADCNRVLHFKAARDENGECAYARAQDRSAFANTTADKHRYFFHEYFHADTGAGLGASHQTGWTALVAKLIQQQGEFGTIAK